GPPPPATPIPCATEAASSGSRGGGPSSPPPSPRHPRRAYAGIRRGSPDRGTSSERPSGLLATGQDLRQAARRVHDQLGYGVGFGLSRGTNQDAGHAEAISAKLRRPHGPRPGPPEGHPRPAPRT